MHFLCNKFNFHVKTLRLQVLFLDEPTSGLDAAAAQSLIHNIQEIAVSHRLIVVMTIHQPSTKVFACFDQLLILSRGRTAYIGSKNGALPYFESIGHPLPDHANPAEHFLDIVNADFADEASVEKILNIWKQQPPERYTTPSLPGKRVSIAAFAPRKCSFAKQFRVLLRRHFAITLRDPSMYLGR